MLERWRRRALVALVLYAAALLFWAFQPWTDTETLVTPVGAPQVVVDFRCPAPWGGTGEPEAKDPVPYPTAGTPCDQRTSLGVLGGVDLVLAGVALAVLVRAGRRRRRRPASDPVAEPDAEPDAVGA